MPYQPLTKEQFDKARSSGFSTDQIIQHEQRRKSESIQQTAAATPSPVPGEGFIKGVGGDLANRVGQEGKVLSDTFTGKISPMSGVVQTVGTGAGAVGDVVGQAAKGLYEGLVPDAIKNPVNNATTGLIQGAVNSPIGQGVMRTYDNFSRANPEIAGDIGALGNVATIFPVGKVASIAKDAAVESLGKGALVNTVDAVTPELTAKSASSAAAKQGLVKSGLLGRITTAPDPYLKQVAKTVLDNVPNFTKLATYADKVNETRKAVYLLANQLKNDVAASGKDIIYPFKELSSAMGAVEKPWEIKSDAVLTRQFELARSAALKYARESGGTVSGLFDARKAFDRVVEDQFPNLYDRKNAPMRSAITAMRNVMNDFIEKKLPDGFGFKKRLKLQSHLFDAIENMAPKAVKEIGSNSFAIRHPLLTSAAKTGAKVIAGGAAAGLGLGGVQHLLGE